MKLDQQMGSEVNYWWKVFLFGFWVVVALGVGVGFGVLLKANSSISFIKTVGMQLSALDLFCCSPM